MSSALANEKAAVNISVLRSLTIQRNQFKRHPTPITGQQGSKME